MFSIQTDTFAGFERIKLLNEVTGEYLTVIPECGGIVEQLVLSKNKKLHSVLKGVSEEELPGNSWYRSAVLFPYVNRIRDGKYHFEGKNYQLLINETDRYNALHGLVLDDKWSLESKQALDYEVFVLLTYRYDGSLAGYPFPFVLHLKYSLQARPDEVSSAFSMAFTIENVGETAMPLAMGWHAYFATGTKIDELELELPSGEFFETDERLLPTGKIQQRQRFSPSEKIGNIQLDTCFRNPKPENSWIYLSDPQKNISIAIGSRHTLPFYQIFTAPDRECIAIEPQTCGIDAFNGGIEAGLLTLEPSQPDRPPSRIFRGFEVKLL
jgi:aldose 1-epimerase